MINVLIVRNLETDKKTPAVYLNNNILSFKVRKPID